MRGGRLGNCIVVWLGDAQDRGQTLALFVVLSLGWGVVQCCVYFLGGSDPRQ